MLPIWKNNHRIHKKLHKIFASSDPKLTKNISKENMYKLQQIIKMKMGPEYESFFKKIYIRELTEQKEIHTIQDDHLIFQ